MLLICPSVIVSVVFSNLFLRLGLYLWILVFGVFKHRSSFLPKRLWLWFVLPSSLVIIVIGPFLSYLFELILYREVLSFLIFVFLKSLCGFIGILLK
jgi:hypothetical protein